MADPDWIKAAMALQPGRFVRIEHGCGEGRTLRVSKEQDGAMRAYCFRCGPSGFLPAPELTLAERLALLEQRRTAELKVTATVDPPRPMIKDVSLWPLYAKVWLFKAGLSVDDIASLGAYYCEPIDRVVLPVYDNGKLVYWQARGFRKGAPKYINPIVERNSLCAKYGSGPVLVLTEDILSAYRVSRVTEAWSLLGTKLPDGVAVGIAQQRKPIVMLLDHDSAGAKGRAQVARQLRTLGAEVFISKPDRDPKYLTRKETLACVMKPMGDHSALATLLAASSAWQF
jgi:hypothetical protein